MVNWEYILKKQGDSRLLDRVERIVDDLKAYDLNDSERREADELISLLADAAMKGDSETYNKHNDKMNRWYAENILKPGKFKK